MVRLPWNEKQTYQLNHRAQMWPSGLTLAMTLTLNFQGQIYNLLYLSQKWSDCHETKSKHIDWTLGLKCDHLVWPWPWPWPRFFKVKYRICYISAKNGPIATKRKANIWIELQGLKCDHQIRPWPQPWPWIFKVKYGSSYISAKSVPIATKRKANISIELQASNVTNGFDLDHNLDLWIWRSNVTLTFDHTRDLDHGFSWSNFDTAVSQNGRADWHCTKGVAVGHSWPWPWPWPFGDQGQVYGSTR